METTALIVTDGTENTQKMAEAIAAELKPYKVNLITAEDFDGTDLLPASLCFFGADHPEPPSFTYLFKMLQHINLAEKPCGIFSGSKKAAEYLFAMVNNSEIDLYPDPFLGKGDIKKWVKEVLAKL